MALTTVELLRDIRSRTKLPASQLNFTDADTLRVATDELWSDVAPMVMAEQQEHFVTHADVPLVSGRAEYRVPSGAMGAKLRNAVLVYDATGQTVPLERFRPEDVLGRETVTGLPEGFVVEGTRLRLYPRPASTYGASLRLSYYGRPGALVLPTACARVEAVDTATGDVTLQPASAGNGGPEIINTDTATVDLVRAQPHFETLAAVTGTLVGSVLTLAPAAVLELQPGDWVCLPGTAPVPQVPLELHPLLVAKVAAFQLGALGDTPGAEVQAAAAAGKEQRAGALILPRVDGAPLRQRGGQSRWRGNRFRG